METSDPTVPASRSNGTERSSPSRVPPGRDPKPDRVPKAEAGRELSAAWAEIRGDLARIGAEVRTIGALRVERARLATHEGLHAVLLGGWAALAASAATVVSASILVLGLAGAIAALAGAAWVGQLLGGLLALLASLATLILLRNRMRAGFQAEVARKYPLETEGEARP